MLSFTLALQDASGPAPLGLSERAWIAQAVQQAALDLGASQRPVVTFVQAQATTRRRGLAAACPAGSGGSCPGSGGGAAAGAASAAAAWQMVVTFALGDEAIAQQLGGLLMSQPQLVQGPGWSCTLMLTGPRLGGQPLDVAAQGLGHPPPPAPHLPW